MTFSTLITNGHPATTTVIAPAAVALLLLHHRPQPARPPNGPPVFEFGLVTDVQAADSGEGTRSIMWRPLGLPVCRLLAARVRPAAFEPVATTTRARAFARKHHEWSRQSTLERRQPLRISNACWHTALKSCSRGRQPLPPFRPRDALIIALHLSACYYRRELALGRALLVLDTIEQSTHGWPVGSVEAGAYLASHDGEERKRQPPLPPPPPSPPPSPPPWPPFISTSLLLMSV